MLVARLLITITLTVLNLQHSSTFTIVLTQRSTRSITRHLRELSSKMQSSIGEETKDSSLKPKDAKGVIFDIDGTLANSWKLGFDATQVVLEKNNIDRITEELYHECTRYCTPDRLARHAGLLPGDEEFEREGERLGQEFDELYVGLVSVETAGFYDGIHNLLLSLPKDDVKIAALTNACVAYAYSVLQINCPAMSNQNGNEATDDDQNGIYKRFISIHGADTVPKPKPDPAGLYQICSEIEIDPSVCVYIGDSPSDAVAAKEAGMIAIGVLWGSHPVESLRKAPFDFLCNNVQDLYDLLLE